MSRPVRELWSSLGAQPGEDDDLLVVGADALALESVFGGTLEGDVVVRVFSDEAFGFAGPAELAALGVFWAPHLEDTKQLRAAVLDAQDRLRRKLEADSIRLEQLGFRPRLEAPEPHLRGQADVGGLSLDVALGSSGELLLTHVDGGEVPEEQRVALRELDGVTAELVQGRLMEHAQRLVEEESADADAAEAAAAGVEDAPIKADAGAADDSDAANDDADDADDADEAVGAQDNTSVSVAEEEAAAVEASPAPPLAAALSDEDLVDSDEGPASAELSGNGEHEGASSSEGGAEGADEAAPEPQAAEGASAWPDATAALSDLTAAPASFAAYAALPTEQMSEAAPDEAVAESSERMAGFDEDTGSAQAALSLVADDSVMPSPGEAALPPPLSTARDAGEAELDGERDGEEAPEPAADHEETLTHMPAFQTGRMGPSLVSSGSAGSSVEDDPDAGADDELDEAAPPPLADVDDPLLPEVASELEWEPDGEPASAPDGALEPEAVSDAVSDVVSDAVSTPEAVSEAVPAADAELEAEAVEPEAVGPEAVLEAVSAAGAQLEAEVVSEAEALSEAVPDASGDEADEPASDDRLETEPTDPSLGLIARAIGEAPLDLSSSLELDREPEAEEDEEPTLTGMPAGGASGARFDALAAIVGEGMSSGNTGAVVLDADAFAYLRSFDDGEPLLSSEDPDTLEQAAAQLERRARELRAKAELLREREAAPVAPRKLAESLEKARASRADDDERLDPSAEGAPSDEGAFAAAPFEERPSGVPGHRAHEVDAFADGVALEEVRAMLAADERRSDIYAETHLAEMDLGELDAVSLSGSVFEGGVSDEERPVFGREERTGQGSVDGTALASLPQAASVDVHALESLAEPPWEPPPVEKPSASAPAPVRTPPVSPRALALIVSDPRARGRLKRHLEETFPHVVELASPGEAVTLSANEVQAVVIVRPAHDAATVSGLEQLEGSGTRPPVLVLSSDASFDGLPGVDLRLELGRRASEVARQVLEGLSTLGVRASA